MPQFDLGSTTAAGTGFGPLYSPATGKRKFTPKGKYGIGIDIADNSPFKPIATALIEKKDAPIANNSEIKLNDFIALAKASGKSNATNRGYQMFKNYQKTGKLPARRLRPDD